MTEIEKLDRALADHAKAIKEHKFKLQLSSLQAKLDWKSWVAGAAAFEAATGMGLPLVGAALSVAGAVAAASVSVTASLVGRKSSSTPFEYVTRFHREL